MVSKLEPVCGHVHSSSPELFLTCLIPNTAVDTLEVGFVNENGTSVVNRIGTGASAVFPQGTYKFLQGSLLIPQSQADCILSEHRADSLPVQPQLP